jgi:hypothetical protein
MIGRGLAFSLLCACGGQLDPSADAGEDAAADVRPLIDVAVKDVVIDTTPSCTDGGTCTAPMVKLVHDISNMQCKFDITWTCGSITYEVYSPPGIGGCDPTNDSTRGFRGICLQCGQTESKFDMPDPGACTCFDDAKLSALVAKQCGFPQ